MFKRFRNNKKSFYKELVVPEGCRELTDEEMFRINGGSTEKKDGSQGSQDSKGESQSSSVTVQSGNTMSQIVSDYNKANGTNYTVNEIAQKNGISNPDVIHPGQHINFGDSSSGAGNMSAGSSASQANGNYGANGSYGSNGVYASNTSTKSSSESGKMTSTASSTGTSYSSRESTPLSQFSTKVSNTFKRTKTQLAEKAKKGNAVSGEESIGIQANGNSIIGQNVSASLRELKEKLVSKTKNEKAANQTPNSANWGKLENQDALTMRMQDYRDYKDVANKKNQANINAKDTQMNGSNSFSLSGCKMCGAAKIASEVAGRKIEMKDDINDKYDANADGYMSLEEVTSAINANVPEGKTLKSDWFEKTLTKEKLDEIAGWDGTTYILGKAENVHNGDPHWVVLSGYSVNNLGQLQFDYSPTSINDTKNNRSYILSDPKDGQTNTYKIVKIETFNIQ